MQTQDGEERGYCTNQGAVQVAGDVQGHEGCETLSRRWLEGVAGVSSRAQAAVYIPPAREHPRVDARVWGGHFAAPGRLEECQVRYERARAGRRPTMDDINTAMRGLERWYCPLGTRDELHKEIRSLRKTRALSVEEYDQRFHSLLELEPWVQIDDGAAMTVTDQCRYYSDGMPRSWQMQVVPQRSRWDNVDKLKARYVQCERVENTGSQTSEHVARPKQPGKHKREETRGPKAMSKSPSNGNKKRKVETGEGCSFCRSRGNVWDNHRGEECFRNPASPKYRPRTNNSVGGKSWPRIHKRQLLQLTTPGTAKTRWTTGQSLKEVRRQEPQ